MANMVNKFNVNWQMVRVRAKAIKDVDAKIKLVMDFLNDNPNVHNYGRVMNWLKTTAMAYKIDSIKKSFEKAIRVAIKNESMYNNKIDMSNDMTEYSDDDLLMLYKDLSKRKYGFQFKSTPAAHIKFVDELSKELKKRRVTH